MRRRCQAYVNSRGTYGLLNSDVEISLKVMKFTLDPSVLQRRKTDLPQVTYKLSQCCIEYTSPCAGFELTTLVVKVLIAYVVVNPMAKRSRPRRRPY